MPLIMAALWGLLVGFMFGGFMVLIACKRVIDNIRLQPRDARGRFTKAS